MAKAGKPRGKTRRLEKEKEDQTKNITGFSQKESKMKTNNKTLGKGFEREVAHKLTKLFQECELIDKDVEFYPTVGSGMMAHHRKGMSQEVQDSLAGDIACPPGFPFVIECKRRKGNPDFHKIIRYKNHDIFRWMFEVSEDADRIGKERMIIMKYLPRHGTYVAMPNNIFRVWYPVLGAEPPPALVWYHWQGERWCIFDWEIFVQMVDEDFDGWMRSKLNA